MMNETVQANKPTAEINQEVVTMLFGLYQQGEEGSKTQEEMKALLQELVNKEPVKVTTKEVTFPAVIEVEEVSPVKEVSVSNFPALNLPNFKQYFDAHSTENVKGQFAIIDSVDRLTEFLKSIDWSKLTKQSVSDFGGVYTPAWKPLETPSGAIDGSNKIFTLSTTPRQNALFLFLGGILQTENEDYTISRNIITYTNAPPEGVSPHVARFQV
ncbi:MAG: hypothetical protein WBV94_08410 [Blastocatellia bacterium]